MKDILYVYTYRASLISILFSYSLSEAKKEVPDPMNIILNNNKKPDPIDNVWIARFHKFKICPFEEAVQNHRETHHPTIYNLPNAPIKALIGLDMQVNKKNRFCRVLYVYMYTYACVRV